MLRHQSAPLRLPNEYLNLLYLYLFLLKSEVETFINSLFWTFLTNTNTSFTFESASGQFLSWRLGCLLFTGLQDISRHEVFGSLKLGFSYWWNNEFSK